MFSPHQAEAQRQSNKTPTLLPTTTSQTMQPSMSDVCLSVVSICQTIDSVTLSVSFRYGKRQGVVVVCGWVGERGVKFSLVSSDYLTSVLSLL